MAALWKETADGFAARPLKFVGGTAVDDGSYLGEARQAFRIVTFRDGAAPRYAFLSGAEFPARVNGSPVAGGIRVLRHKDELIVDSVRFFFSAESTPLVEVYGHDGSRRLPRCPTCRNEVLEQQAIVRCPGCSRIYHQIAANAAAPAKPCWTYSPTCRFCDHPTALSGEPTWRPDEES